MSFWVLHTLVRFCSGFLALVLGFFLSPLLGRKGSDIVASVSCASSQNECHCSSKSALSAGTELKQAGIYFAVNSVVKVLSVSTVSSIFQPWRNLPQNESSGSGFVISGRKILTNAHVVADHIFVQVKKHGSSTKYKAEVRAIGHECDLAILEIDSDEFWEDICPMEFGEMPYLHESVTVIGYPVGGDSVSITKGAVSRVEFTKYAHGGIELLTVQIDAAINPGNSGGPVIVGNNVAGAAFQKQTGSESIGYIIPIPIIKHFLSGVEEHGKYVGFCSLNISCQLMENDQLHKYFKMSPGMSGVLINEINPLSDANIFLEKCDVILAIDGVSIGNDATVPFRRRERISFSHLVSMKKPGEKVLLKILREGKEHEFNISLKPVQRLVPLHMYDKLPSYYIFAGFVFLTLSEPYMKKTEICKCVINHMPKNAGKEIVMISEVLADDINAGYICFSDVQVKKVNGVKVENLKHLYRLIEECCTEDIRLDLKNKQVIILNYQNAKAATSLILENHRIPSATSKDLQS